MLLSLTRLLATAAIWKELLVSLNQPVADSVEASVGQILPIVHGTHVDIKHMNRNKDI